MSVARPPAAPPSLNGLSMDTPPFADKADYERALAREQRRLLEIQLTRFVQRRRAVVVFEGWDASGKGGAIRRMTGQLDPRGFRVWPIGPPTEAEKAQPYLWRFWTRLPEPGTIAIFDRSWYGRVLVERVEGLAGEASWRCAYDEINAFEELLVRDGVRVVKLFLHITREEQAARFRDRLVKPMKAWKITADDLRARARWDDYVAAVEEMFLRTSTAEAPWTLIPANSKWHARVACLRRVADALADGLEIAPPPVDPEVRRTAERMGLV